MDNKIEKYCDAHGEPAEDLSGSEELFASKNHSFPEQRNRPLDLWPLRK